MKRRYTRKRRSPARMAAFKRARSRAAAMRVLMRLAEAIPFADYLPAGMREWKGGAS